MNQIPKIILFFSCFISYLYSIDCHFFGEFQSYGGHYYTTTAKRMSFEEAKTLAKRNGGYLAIPNNAQENQFLSTLVPRGQYAWIGIHDPNFTQNHCLPDRGCHFSDTRFRDINNKPLSYSNWATNQPDNLLKEYDVIEGKEVVSPLGEHWVAMAFNGQWADMGNHAGEENPKKEYALVEFDTQPVCHSAPQTDVFNDGDLLGKCNSWISDDANYPIDESKGVQNLSCLKDPKGTSFCPINLTECRVDNGDKVNGGVRKIKAKMQKRYIDITYNTGRIYWYSRFVDIKFNINDIRTITSFKATAFGADDWAILYPPNRAITDSQRDKQGLLYVPYNSNGRFWETARYNGATAEALNRLELRGHLRNGRNFIRMFFSTWDGGSWYAIFRIIGEGISCANVTPQWGQTCSSGFLYEDYNYYEYTCPSGYSAINKGGNCHPKSIRDLVDTNGDGIGDSCPNSTPPPLNCQGTTKFCPFNKDRACVQYDGKLQCSPHPCFAGGSGGNASLVENINQNVGVNDVANNGWREDGSCGGQLLVFNGKSHSCRSSDKLLGLSGGGCCNKNKVFLGLVSCKENEKNLAKLNQQSLCKEIGEYCSKRIKLGFAKVCIQKSKSHCCFNSLLARIFNEQGRQQIGKGWGSGESPNCSGFTTEEFQKLDFSKMDLSEFTNSLNFRVNDSFAKGQAEKIKDRVQQSIHTINSMKAK